jgi:hypothetical protein
MKRVTYKNIIERKNNSNYSDLPKLSDILVDLSVKNTKKVVRSLRLIGLPIEFYEYNANKRDPENRGKFIKVPFPDADKNNKITRIGHEDRSKCPWYAAGYVGSKRYAVRCLEKQEDETWLPKILCKGSSIFGEFATWELGRIEEGDPTTSKFLGGDSAPIVRVQATFDKEKLGDVDYKVFVNSKDMELTEDLINLMRSIREPSADELSALRKEYNKDREEDESMPEWRDYFEYGYDLRRIFKFTPPMVESETKSEAPVEVEEVFTEGVEESSELDDLNLDGVFL